MVDKRICPSWHSLQEDISLLVDFPGQAAPLLLTEPHAILSTHRPDQVVALLQQAEFWAKEGAWVGGWIGYEAASAFDLPVHLEEKGLPVPLLWLARFDGCQPVIYPHPDALPVPRAGDSIAWTPKVSSGRHEADLRTIQAYIQAGESYQVNYTLSADLKQSMSLAMLFLRLQPQHRFPYAVWLNTGDALIASFSPELLIERGQDRLTTAPIKGTRPRMAACDLDNEARLQLLASEKDGAEHVMIVDMARNDLGKICAVGSVQVPHLMACRSFSTVHHLESRVIGTLRHGLGLPEVMAALFPAASITGAPKKRTMEVIRQLEKRPRGFYTGSLGVIRPGGDFTFNVAIRTVTWKRGDPGAEIGLGGGIVADSIPREEWAEIGDKGAFLCQVPEPFGLIETFLVDERGAVRGLAGHLDRWQRSAYQLGFPMDRGRQAAFVVRTVRRMREEKHPFPRILRVVLGRDGRSTYRHRPYVSPPETLNILLSPHPVDRWDDLLRHKTTRRDCFDQAFELAQRQGYEDSLFVNTLGRVTEGAIRAILVKDQGRWFAPPLCDGALASLWRQGQMERLQATEKSLTLADLRKVEEIRMGNAVQGGRRVATIWQPSGDLIYRASASRTQRA